MARSINDIIVSIFADKNSRPELNSLNSTSKVAIFRNLIYVSANAQLQLEILQDRFEEEVNEIIRNNFIGTPEWYAERTKEFQLNYDLILTNNRFQYPTIDEVSKIIKAVAVSEQSGGTLTIKVAKENSGLDLVSLTSEEKIQLNKYLTKIKLAGTRINLVSLNGDQLLMSGTTVYYDSIYSLATIQTSVEDALKSFIRNLPFDGKLKLNDVIDTIQSVTGIEDIEINNLAIKSGLTIIPVGRILELPSGYLNEPSSPLSFADLITYQPV